MEKKDHQLGIGVGAVIYLIGLLTSPNIYDVEFTKILGMGLLVLGTSLIVGNAASMEEHKIIGNREIR